MGWLFSYNITEKKDMVAERIENWKNEVEIDGVQTLVTAECLAHSVKGRCLWTVWEIAKTSIDKKELFSIDRYIRLDLIEKQDGHYGYKGMDESAGPCYYDCPLKFLDMVPEVTRQTWRDKVKEYHAAKRSKISARASVKVGDTIKLVNASIPQVVVVSKVKNKIFGSYQGQTYKVAPRFIGEVISA